MGDNSLAVNQTPVTSAGTNPAGSIVFSEPEILSPAPWQGRDLNTVLEQNYLALLKPEVAAYFKEEVAAGRLQVSVRTEEQGGQTTYVLESSNFGTGEGRYSFQIAYTPTYNAAGQITELYMESRDFRDHQSPTNRGWGGTRDYYGGALWIAQQMGIPSLKLVARTPELLTYFSDSLEAIGVTFSADASVSEIIIPVPEAPLPTPSAMSLQGQQPATFVPIIAPPSVAPPVTPVTSTPSAEDLYGRIMSIGPNNQPWYMSFIPAEIAAAYPLDQISVTLENGQIIIKSLQSYQSVYFQIALKVHPEGGFLEIADLKVEDNSINLSVDIIREHEVLQSLLEGLRQIGVNSNGLYNNIYINTLTQYHSFYLLMSSGFSFAGDEAAFNQMQAAIAEIENRVMQANIGGQILLTGALAMDLATIDKFIKDNNLWPADLQLGMAITASPIENARQHMEWYPMAATAMPAGPNVDLQPGQTIIYYYNHQYYYYVTMAEDGQSVYLRNHAGTVQIREGAPDIGRPFYVLLQDGQLYMPQFAGLPNPQATLNGEHLMVGSMVAAYRNENDPTANLRGGMEQHAYLPATSEVEYLGYHYTLLSLPDGHIQITMRTPSGETQNLGELGMNENIGPFFAGFDGVVFFPYLINEQGPGLIIPGPEATLPTAPTTSPQVAANSLPAPVEAAHYDHGLYTEATYISLNRYLLSVGRTPSWLTINLDLDPIEAELSAEVRDQIQAGIYDRLWQIAKAAGIMSPIVVLHEGGFAINIPDILPPEVQQQITVAINEGLNAQFSDTQLVRTSEGGAVLSFIRVQASDARPVSLERTSSDAEMLGALETGSADEQSVTISQIPVSAEGTEFTSSFEQNQTRILAAVEQERAFGVDVAEVVLKPGYFELWGADGDLLNLNGIMLEYPAGQLPSVELRQQILFTVGNIQLSGTRVEGIIISNGHFMLYGTNNTPINIDAVPFKLEGEMSAALNHGDMIEAWDLANKFNLNPIGAVVHENGSFEIELESGHVVDSTTLKDIKDAWDTAQAFGLEPTGVNLLTSHYEIINSQGVIDLRSIGSPISSFAGLPPLDIYQAQRLAGNNFLPFFGYLMHGQEGIPTGTFTVYINSEGRVMGHQQGNEVVLVDDRGRAAGTISQEQAQAQGLSQMTVKINKTTFGDAELTYVESFELPSGADPALAEVLRVSFDWNNGSLGNLLIVGFNTVNGHSSPASAHLAAQMTDFLHTHQVQAVSVPAASLPTGFAAELNQIRTINPQLADLLETHLSALSAEERAALGIDITDLREFKEYLAAVQDSDRAIENSSEYAEMNELLNDLGLNSEMETFSQITGQMFTLRLTARYGNDVAGIILSQVDFSDFSRSQFKTMMNAVNKAYLGNNSAINYLSNIYTAEQISTIRTTLGNQDIRRFEQLANSGQPLTASQYTDFQNFVKQMQKSFNAELLAALGGQQKLDALSTRVEAAQQATQAPAAPAAPAAAPVSIVDVLKKKFDLSETEVQQLIELMSRPGITEEQFMAELVEMGLSLDINTLKQTINQALMDEISARIAADPTCAEAIQQQFNMHGGKISLGSILSEISEEVGQEWAQGGILAILKTNSPLVQFLLEPVVEGEFWAAMAHGNFGVLKQFFGEMMPATSAGMVGASLYNAILSAFGVSSDSAARGLLPQITVGVMSTIGYSALIGAGGSSSAFIRALSRLLSNPMTQRLFVALALSGPIASQMSSWMGYSNDMAVGATIAQQDHPTAFGVLSSLFGSEWATMILNDSNDILNYELQLADQAGQAEATGHNLMDALSALVLLYMAKNPPSANPELYTDYALQVTTDNPDLSDPQYYQGLIDFISQATSSQSNLMFDPARLISADPLAGEDPTQPTALPDFLDQNSPQLNQAELAYAMLVGIAQGQDISGQQAIYQALGLMDSDGQPIESNQYVQEGLKLFDERRQNEESVGLITQIEGFIAHEGQEALESVQVTNRRVDQARAADLVPGLDVNLPPELLGDSRGVIDSAVLMHYVIGQNQGAIDDITAQQQKIMAALDLVVRALGGEAVELDFDDPTIQAVLNYLTHHLPAQS